MKSDIASEQQKLYDSMISANKANFDANRYIIQMPETKNYDEMLKNAKVLLKNRENNGNKFIKHHALIKSKTPESHTPWNNENPISSSTFRSNYNPAIIQDIPNATTLFSNESPKRSENINLNKNSYQSQYSYYTYSNPQNANMHLQNYLQNPQDFNVKLNSPARSDDGYYRYLYQTAMREKEALGAKLLNAKRKNDELLKELGNAKRNAVGELREMKDKVNELTNENNYLNYKIKVLNSEMDKLVNLNANLQINGNKNNLSESNKEDFFSRNSSETEYKNKNLQSLISDNNARYEKLREEKEKILVENINLKQEQDKLSEMYKQLMDKYNNLKTSYEKINKTYIDLQNEISTLNSENEELKQKFDEINEENEKLQNSIEELKNGNEELSNENKFLNEENMNLKENLDELSKEKDERSDEDLKAYVENAKLLKNQINDIQAELSSCANLKERLSEALRTNQNLGVYLDSLNVTLRSRDEEIADNRQKIRDLERGNSEKIEEIENLRRRNRENEDKLREMERDMGKMKSENEGMKYKLNDNKSSNNNSSLITNNNKELQEKYEKLGVEYNNLKEKFDIMKKDEMDRKIMFYEKQLDNEWEETRKENAKNDTRRMKSGNSDNNIIGNLYNQGSNIKTVPKSMNSDINKLNSSNLGISKENNFIVVSNDLRNQENQLKSLQEANNLALIKMECENYKKEALEYKNKNKEFEIRNNELENMVRELRKNISNNNNYEKDDIIRKLKDELNLANIKCKTLEDENKFITRASQTISKNYANKEIAINNQKKNMEKIMGKIQNIYADLDNRVSRLSKPAFEYSNKIEAEKNKFANPSLSMKSNEIPVQNSVYNKNNKFINVLVTKENDIEIKGAIPTRNNIMLTKCSGIKKSIDRKSRSSARKSNNKNLLEGLNVEDIDDLIDLTDNNQAQKRSSAKSGKNSVNGERSGNTNRNPFNILDGISSDANENRNSDEALRERNHALEAEVAGLNLKIANLNKALSSLRAERILQGEESGERIMALLEVNKELEAKLKSGNIFMSGINNSNDLVYNNKCNLLTKENENLKESILGLKDMIIGFKNDHKDGDNIKKNNRCVELKIIRHENVNYISPVKFSEHNTFYNGNENYNVFSLNNSEILWKQEYRKCQIEINSLKNHIEKLLKDQGCNEYIKRLKNLLEEKDQKIKELLDQLAPYQKEVDNVLNGMSELSPENQIKLLIQNIKGISKKFINVSTLYGKISNFKEFMFNINKVRDYLSKSKNNEVKEALERIDELIEIYKDNENLLENRMIQEIYGIDNLK